VPPDSVRCTRELYVQLFTFGNFQRSFAIIHRTVRCSTGQCPVLQGRATLNSPASGIRSAIIHRTVRCTTGQCPVHQGTLRPTLHLREFSEELRYNSPDCPVHHRTVSGAPGESNSELASFGNPLRYNSPDCPVHTGLSGVTAGQRLLRVQRLSATH
jgi:hypothetical protein